MGPRQFRACPNVRGLAKPSSWKVCEHGLWRPLVRSPGSAIGSYATWLTTRALSVRTSSATSLLLLGHFERRRDRGEEREEAERVGEMGGRVEVWWRRPRRPVQLVARPRCSRPCHPCLGTRKAKRARGPVLLHSSPIPPLHLTSAVRRHRLVG